MRRKTTFLNTDWESWTIDKRIEVHILLLGRHSDVLQDLGWVQRAKWRQATADQIVEPYRRDKALATRKEMVR